MTDIRILLVDDDRELGAMLAEFLAPDHFDVTACLSGEDGLQALRDKEFDLLILDIMLPGVNGIDVLKQVRQTSDIPIIMLTCRDENEAVLEGLQVGAIDYIPKDAFSDAVLLETLRQMGIIAATET